jgi:hypothetical protein
MSEFDRSMLPEQGPPDTTAQAVMGILGTFLLLPGGCALVFAVSEFADFLRSGRVDRNLGPLALLWLFCFALSVLGVLMIRAARKKARRSS